MTEKLLTGTLSLNSNKTVPAKCRACDITKYAPFEFTIIKSWAMTLSRSSQCRAFSRALMAEKLLFVPANPCRWGGGGAVVTND